LGLNWIRQGIEVDGMHAVDSLGYVKTD